MPCLLTASADGPREMASASIVGQLHSSYAALQSGHGEGLHDRLRGLRLYHDNLSEDLPLACPGGGLGTSLNPHKTWDCEDAGLAHLFGRDLRDRLDDLCCRLRLQLVLRSEGP